MSGYVLQTSIKLGNSTLDGKRAIPHAAWIAVSRLQQSFKDQGIESYANMDGREAFFVFQNEYDLTAARIML